MSIILCQKCDTLFDSDVEVNAQFVPEYVCEDCLRKAEATQLRRAHLRIIFNVLDELDARPTFQWSTGGKV